ncbi:Sec-independent protein translocase subunit TatA/TatB [Alicyclobacillus sendaiensis]|uniref:Twin-arginine translocase TatA/TatE family subunit n=1 Tax=Alicyclobacillus sendaiensis PA2 TaxID=3029425 RepID=A0ABT6Y1H5_ALISE|nr:twin-arginine translocase TatA/TatE family subunit [Alicyclobacillus sendaiensis]MDI9261203.1 twin-arginine translocase TatA/TatE family subunit [Alicyclobacillus sendaiensis PA2]
MFTNVGWSGILLIVVAALFVFGPKKLPELGRSVGHFLREFRTALGDRDDARQAPPTDEGGTGAPQAASAAVRTEAHAPSSAHPSRSSDAGAHAPADGP